jgi:hypothetical protein
VSLDIRLISLQYSSNASNEVNWGRTNFWGGQIAEKPLGGRKICGDWVFSRARDSGTEANMAQRYRFFIQYNGANFIGYQRNPSYEKNQSGHKSVQSTFEVHKRLFYMFLSNVLRFYLHL